MRRDREERGSRRGSMRDKARKRAEQREFRSGGARFNLEGGTKFFQIDPKRKIHRLDIIPYQVTTDTNPEVDKGELWYQRTMFVHYSIGAEEKSYICPKTIGKPCPICENRAALMKNPDASDEDIDALRPRERELFNVIDLDEPDKGVQLWEISYHAFGKQLEEEIREGSEEWAGFADLKGGFTLLCRFKEERLGKNKFTCVNRIDFEEREDYEDKTLKEVFDLDAVLKVLPYDELERVFLGIEDEDRKSKRSQTSEEESEPEEEEEEAPKPSRNKPKGRTSEPAEEDETDDEPEQNEEDEEGSEPEAEGEGEGEEDDEEESPRPRPSPKRGTETPAKKPVQTTSGKEPKCPHGGQFGKDCDRLEECDDCDIWTQCRDKKDKIARSKK